MRRFFAALMVAGAMVLATSPAASSDKYVVHDDQPMDAARKPAAGKALIYFVRTQTMGMAIKFKLYGNSKFLGLIQSKTFIPLEVPAGRYEFIAAAENAAFLNAEVAPNKIYVVQVGVKMGAMKARTKFEVARTGSEVMEEFMNKQEDLRAVTTTDEGLQWVKDEDAKVKETVAKYKEKGAEKGEEPERLKPEDGFDRAPWVK